MLLGESHQSDLGYFRNGKLLRSVHHLELRKNRVVAISVQ